METVFGYKVNINDIKKLIYENENEAQLYEDVELDDDRVYKINGHDVYYGSDFTYNKNGKKLDAEKEFAIIVAHQADSNSIKNSPVEIKEISQFCKFINELYQEGRIVSTELVIDWI